MELERVLDEFDNMIMDATRVPLTNKCVIDMERLCKAIDDIRASVPHELKKAQQLLATRERYIEEAREEKEQIIKKAEALAERMISEQEIYKQSIKRADDIVQSADEESSAMRRDAEQYSQKTKSDAVNFANSMHEDTMLYVKDVFDYLETTLGNVDKALAQSKEALAKKGRGES